MKKVLHFVSSNETKIREAQYILGIPIEIANLELTEIQDIDIEKIVRQKAIDAFERVKDPVIVDDVGVYVEEWKGFPGPFIKYLIKAGGNQLLLEMLGNSRNRKAEFVSAIGYYDGKQVQTFLGKVTGKITDKVRVSGNKMVDAVFIPDGYTRVYAEMSLEEKSTLSHRKKALEKLRSYFSENDTNFS